MESALSQVRLVESGPGVGQVSEPLTLTCAVSGESISSSDYLWYRIPASPGAGLEYLGVITRSGTPFPAQSLRNRLSISRDTARSQVSLQLLSLTAADTATYHCARRESQPHRHRRERTWRGDFSVGRSLSLAPCFPARGAPSCAESGCRSTGVSAWA
uniref:Ig-like domain-containing protein n=1 Tax=Chelydra serpentina TaxID=8475 RepID=A0A8C3XQW1_CHESE